MARPYPSNTILPKGQLTIKEIRSGKYLTWFTPPEEAIRGNNTDPADYKRPIFQIDFCADILSIYPYHVWGLKSMDSRYFTLTVIMLDFSFPKEHFIPDEDGIKDFLSYILPQELLEDYNYGLGFKKIYKPIVSMLETFGVETLHITRKAGTEINLDEKKASVSYSGLSILVRNINNISAKAQKISSSLKKESTGELFLEMLMNNEKSPNRKSTSDELVRRLGKSNRLSPGGATKKEQRDAIEVIRQNGKRIINEQPEALIKLRNDIDLVTLEELIGRFDLMLSKQLTESHWQKLFNQNPFILNMAFGIPVIKIQGQASVGGLSFSGTGTKIADFLVKNSITSNAAIVEIKTPDAKLINPSEYRRGVYAPAIDLTASVNQVLDQIYMFQRDISSLKNSSREANLESYSVSGILITGTIMTGLDEQKSFELFRGNSKSVQIITFDELLNKLKALHSFLSPTGRSEVIPQGADSVQFSEDNLPF